MNRRYEGEEFDDFVDRVTADETQREVDDKAEAQRAASGFSPEQYVLLEAANLGKKAGLWGCGPHSNPYPEGTPEHGAWEKARSLAIGARLNGTSMRRLP